MLQDNVLTNKPSMNPELLLGISPTIQRALTEDIGLGDITTNSIVPANASLHGRIVAKQQGVVAGLEVANLVLLELSDQIVFRANVSDGAQVKRGTVLAQLEGSARSLLTGERTALNFLGRMSGIATLTRQFVDAVSGTGAVILDTRKTAPGLRALDKLAVKRGGGQNHRMNLHEMALVNTNPIDYDGALA